MRRFRLTCTASRLLLLCQTESDGARLQSCLCGTMPATLVAPQQQQLKLCAQSALITGRDSCGHKVLLCSSQALVHTKQPLDCPTGKCFWPVSALATPSRVLLLSPWPAVASSAEGTVSLLLLVSWGWCVALDSLSWPGLRHCLPEARIKVEAQTSS